MIYRINLLWVELLYVSLRLLYPRTARSRENRKSGLLYYSMFISG